MASSDPDPGESQKKKAGTIDVKLLSDYVCPVAKKHFDDLVSLESTKLVNFSDLIRESAPEEDYFVLGILYHVVHARHDMTETKEPFGMNKRQKKNYNRMLFFGSLDGSTACLVLREKRVSGLTLDKCRGGLIGVGTPFLLYQPVSIGVGNMKINQITIQMDFAIIPLEVSVIKHLPTVSVDPVSGEETFFLVRGTDVRITNPVMITKHNPEGASCTGRFCDRQQRFAINQECGCISVERNVSGFVLQYSVKFKLPDVVKPVFVRGQRSFRTTLLFVKEPDSCNYGQVSNSPDTKKVREAVAECCKYILDHGGFTLMGKRTLGETKDEGGTGVADVEAVRVVYCYATEPDNVKKEDYEKMMYKYGSD